MNEALNRLSEISDRNVASRKRGLLNENYSFEHVAYAFTLQNWTNAWNAYLNKNNIEEAKLYFNENGFIDLNRAALFNHRLFDMQNPRDNFCCVALSDNQNLIQKYCDINYTISYTSRDKEINISFVDYAKKGELVAIFSLCVMHALKKDFEQLEASLNIFKTTLEKNKSASVLLPDYEFLKSLLSNNIDAVKNSIEVFLTPKLHKQRMHDELILQEFISLPAILFLKLSWICGYEIELKNKLIPMDLMPIKPLKTYPESYKELIK